MVCLIGPMSSLNADDALVIASNKWKLQLLFRAGKVPVSGTDYDRPPTAAAASQFLVILLRAAATRNRQFGARLPPGGSMSWNGHRGLDGSRHRRLCRRQGLFMRWLQLRFDGRSTAMRLLIKGH